VAGLREHLNAKNLFYSSKYGHLVGLAKERALHAYRDQERTAQAHAAEIQARKGQLHGLFEPGASPL
jgi:hypothetical protein